MARKILFVDDDALAFVPLAESIKSLTECGFTQVRNFEEAKAAIAEENYDLIIMNIDFPLGNLHGMASAEKVVGPSLVGMDLLFYIRERNEKVPIIGLSVADSQVMVKIFEEEGAVFYSRISANSLSKVIKKAIELLEIK